MSKIIGEEIRGTFFLDDSIKFEPSIVSVGDLTSVQDSILVQGFSFNDQEKNAIIQCFDDTNHVYAFGHDPENSLFSVTFLVFLGSKCMKEAFKASGSLSEILERYKGMKVSRGATVNVTFGKGVTLVGIVLSAAVQLANPELNTVSVVISGKSLYLV